MNTADIVALTRPQLPAMAALAETLRARLLEAIAAGRADEAGDYARLLAYVAPRA